MKSPARLLPILALSGIISLGGVLASSEFPSLVESFKILDTAEARTNLSYKAIGSYTAPNGSVFTLLQKMSTIFSFRDAKGVTSKRTFTSKALLVRYLNAANPKKKAVTNPTATTSTTTPTTVAPAPTPTAQAVTPTPSEVRVPDTATRAS